MLRLEELPWGYAHDQPFHGRASLLETKKRGFISLRAATVETPIRFRLDHKCRRIPMT